MIGNDLSCSSCNSLYSIKNGIPDFRKKNDYWCNVSREKMIELNRLAEETGDWKTAAEEIIPQYINHFESFFRADAQFLWPTSSDSRILDAGCMWGGLTVPVAQFHREVYAIDKTIETLEFLKIRSRQMGVDNIFPVASPIKSLPFSDNFFDLVILNGVLEWVALDEDTILEQHWDGKRAGKTSYRKTPEEMQIEVLKELRRVLKPDGFLYIAIENRYGIQYFLSYPDDHNNVRFVTFLPRFLANIISKYKGKGEYRTYIYSPGQLHNLLKRSNYFNISMYGIFPHYINIKKAFPLNMAKLFKNEIKVVGRLPQILHIFARYLIPGKIAQHTIPSLSAICSKSRDGTEIMPRIQKVLVENRVIDKNENYRLVISNNRYTNYNSTNMVIFKDQTPVYFCKIARDNNCTGLKTEADNLNWVSRLLLESDKKYFQIPSLVYFGEMDGMIVFVVSYLKANNLNLTPHYIVNKGLDRFRIRCKTFRKTFGFMEEKLFLKRVNKYMNKAIDSLVEFQQNTLKRKEDFKVIGHNIIDNYHKLVDVTSNEISDKILKLRERIDEINGVTLFTCAIHGDYDFDNILFFDNGRVAMVDFEHCDKDGSPFYDLVHLIFNPLIIKWETGYLKDETFKVYLDRYGAINYINFWLNKYCDKLDLPHTIIPEIPLLAVLELNSKTFPPFRDPYTYPLYGNDILAEVLSLEI